MIMNNKKGFTLVELLAVIVILAILMVAAASAIITTMNNAKVNLFKDDALQYINSANQAYSTISMTVSDASLYLKSSELPAAGEGGSSAVDNTQYKGMCITIEGLVQNGFLDKALTSGNDLGSGRFGNSQAIKGFVLIETAFDNSASYSTIWVTDGTYYLDGAEKSIINSLKMQKYGVGSKDDAQAVFTDENHDITSNTVIKAVGGSAVSGIRNKISVPQLIEEEKSKTYRTVNLTVKHKNGETKYTGIPCITGNIDNGGVDADGTSSDKADGSST